jgi:hypothetical protein
MTWENRVGSVRRGTVNSGGRSTEIPGSKVITAERLKIRARWKVE